MIYWPALWGTWFVMACVFTVAEHRGRGMDAIVFHADRCTPDGSAGAITNHHGQEKGGPDAC